MRQDRIPNDRTGGDRRGQDITRQDWTGQPSGLMLDAHPETGTEKEKGSTTHTAA
jgi:hypothetical protein